MFVRHAFRVPERFGLTVLATRCRGRRSNEREGWRERTREECAPGACERGVGRKGVREERGGEREQARECVRVSV